MSHYILFLLSVFFITGCTTISSPSIDDNQQPVKVTKHISDKNQLVKNETSIRKKVLLLPFLDADEKVRSEDVRLSAAAAFIQELEKNRNVRILPDEKSEIELKYDKENSFDLKQMSPAALKKGFSLIMEGQILGIKLKNSAEQIGLIRDITTSYEVVVRLRIVNTRTENEVFNTVKTVTVKEDSQRVVERVSSDQFFAQNPDLVKVLIKEAFLDFIPQIQLALADTSWEGRIAAIRGEKIYLNVGKISGVQVGDILKVVEDGSEIYDPEIGYHLGRIRGNSKGTLEVISFFGQDGAVAVMHSGANFKESDRVEIFE
jgi:hypothetical protein